MKVNANVYAREHGTDQLRAVVTVSGGMLA